MTVCLQADATARSFSAAADTYQRWAVPQSQSAARLVELLPPEADWRLVLDAGCGTGVLLGHLVERFPAASLVGVDIAPGMIESCRQTLGGSPRLSLVVADLEEFRHKQPFDLVASNFCLQWLPDTARSIARLGRLLRPAGLLAAAVPVHGSLVELAHSYRTVTGNDMPGLDFAPREAYLAAVVCAGLRVIQHEDVALTTWFDSPFDVLRHFQATGTTFRHQPGYQPCSVPQTRRLASRYQAEYADAGGRVPLTYRILYLLAER